MVDTVLVDNTTVSDPDLVTQVYSSPTTGAGTLITAFTATNISPASVSYKAYIVDKTGVVGGPVIPQKIVVKDRFDSGPSIVNHVIPAGGSLRLENSTGDGISFFVTGREQ